MKVSDITIYIVKMLCEEIFKEFARVLSEIHKKALKVQILNEVALRHVGVGFSVAGLDHTKFGFYQTYILTNFNL